MDIPFVQKSRVFTYFLYIFVNIFKDDNFVYILHFDKTTTKRDYLKCMVPLVSEKNKNKVDFLYVVYFF